MRRTPQTRDGLTLIEIIVVLAILGLLIALILPAVQSAREASRRAACRANLAQIGQALGAFHAANNHFPSALRPDCIGRDGRPTADLLGYSIHFQLLPYLEQSSLYNAFNAPDELRPCEEHSRDSLPLSALNDTAASTRLTVFLCPSDRPPLRPGVNYRGCMGPYPAHFDEQNWPGGSGAFVAFRDLSARDFADGLSQTVGFSERVVGRGLENRFDSRRDIWYSGVNALVDGLRISNDEMIQVCSSPVTDPPYWPFAGRYWAASEFANTLYNHVGPPNAPWPDCSGHPEPKGREWIGVVGAVSARSLHRDGVNVLMMDGSVKSVSDSVDLQLWRALSTRSGREVVALD